MQDIIINLGCISNAFPCIGFQGENEHRRIVFDAGEVYADYPDAVVTMAIKPPVGEVYPKIVTRDGNNVIWSVTAADVAYPDNGAYQLTFTNGTEIIKTYVGVYSVAASIIGNGQPPKPVEDWLKEAQAMLDAFAEMTAEANTLQPGSDATVELTEENEHKVFLFGIPRGYTGNGIASCVLNADYTLTITFTDGNEYTTPSIRGTKGEPGKDGEDGFSPVVVVSEITGGHRVVITDAQGDHTFDVLNGEDGFDPVVVVTTITGGHRVTVTDASGSTSFDVMDGIDGTNGTSAYVWIRYSAAEPTQDSDMKTTPDAWMGIYSGSASSAPTHYTDYAWYNIKGATGEVSQAELDAVETELKSAIDEKASLIHDTVSNVPIATITDGADAPVSALRIAVDPIQAGSGVPSPTNVRPISGRTGAVISVSGADTSDPTTYTVQFGNTVFSGTLTVNADGTGEIAVDGVNVTYDGSDDENWMNTGTASQVPLFNLNLGNYGDVVNESGICDKLPSVTNISSGNTVVGMRVFNSAGYNKARIACRPSWAVVGSTVSDFTAWLAENPLQVVYKLTSPTVIQLSNLPSIKTLLGINNVWADCGNILLMEYGCDTKGYVEKRLSASQSLMELIVTANREDSMKATKAYITGNLLIVNGTLYRATTFIANGATLTVGTNVTATTVAAELAALA